VTSGGGSVICARDFSLAVDVTHVERLAGRRTGTALVCCIGQEARIMKSFASPSFFRLLDLLLSTTNPGLESMDKQRVKGSAQQAKGKMKELAGKAVGNKKLQARGKAEKAAGKVRNAVGGMKDAMRGR
jgi:uncharacterized protein YjbJ (UPF0337 family)